MSDIESLKERLLAVESSRKFGRGTGDMDITTCWHRNPDGPEAAELITTLEVKLADAERAVGPEYTSRVIDLLEADQSIPTKVITTVYTAMKKAMVDASS